MNESTWRNAEITPVFIRAGNFELDQRPAYRPAPFRLLELNGVTYMETSGTEVRVLDGAQNDEATMADLQMRTGFGLYRDPLYIEDSAVGDGSDDTILSVHCVRNI